jgi:hypothetical protein
MGGKLGYGTTFAILNPQNEIVGIISAFEEYSDWRGGMVWWVYDLKIRTSDILSSDQLDQNLVRSYVANLNILLLPEMKNFDIRNIRW